MAHSPLLTRLLAAQAETDETKRGEAVSAALAETTSEHVALREEIRAEFDAIRSKDTHTEVEVETLEALVDLTEKVNESMARAANLADRAAATTSRMEAATPTETPAETEEAAEQDTSAPSAPSGEAPVEPQHTEAPAAAVVEPASEIVEGTVVQTSPNQPVETGELVPVAASGAAHTQSRSLAPTSSRVPLGNVRTSVPEPAKSWSFSIHAAADIPGVATGADLPSLRDLGQAAVARVSGLSRLGKGARSQVGIATIRRESSAFTVQGNDADWDIIEKATSEHALPGGSLIAAGNGWCAPSEYLYDFCPPASVYGLVDLPTILAPRGGVRYPSRISKGVPPAAYPPAKPIGFHFTEEETKTETKPCIDIPCPTWDECRLDVAGLCVNAPILQNRAFPESIDAFMADVLAWHAHEINAWVIAKMVSLATKITIPAPVFDSVDPTGIVDPHGPGALQTLLSAIEMRAEHLRLKYRLGFNSTIEMVAPDWLRGLIRADISKKACIAEWAVSDATIDSYFNARGIRVQWVVDWQDAWASGTATDLGGASFANVWPSTVQVLLYPAGTFFRANLDVITLDSIYDSTNLAQNMFTKLFTEEGIQVCMRCYEASLLEFNLCPNGATGAAMWGKCAAGVAPGGFAAASIESAPAPAAASTAKKK